MKDCFKRFLLPSLALLFFTSAFFGSCTDVDNQLGLGLLPEDQEMVFNGSVIGGINSYMAFSDSLPVSQLGLMVLGNYTVDGFGHLRSGAAVQFVPSAFGSLPKGVETQFNPEGLEDYYEYFSKPIADSIRIYLNVSKFYGDTTKSQKFYIYPINKALPTVYEPVYDEFPAEDYADMANPLFSFNMKGEGTGNITKTLKIEPAGQQYLQSLFDYGADDEYATYQSSYLDSLYRKDFLGLYITPSPDPAEAPKDAALYFLNPISYLDTYYYTLTDYTYFKVYGHNHYESLADIEEGETPIQDTHGYVRDTLFANYSFDDTYVSYPNTNIMVIERDYLGADFNESDFVDTEDFKSGTIPSVETIYVQGLLGVAGYLDFGDEFLSQLRNLAFYEGEERILNINRARLTLWLDDDTNEKMDLAPERMGMYYDYKGYLPLNIPDYYYYYEQQNSIESAYGGYINKSFGYYEMNITDYLRDLLTDDQTPRQVWLAPGHTTEVFYTPSTVAIQNPAWDGTGDPPKTRMQLKLTYTLLKKTIKN